MSIKQSINKLVDASIARNTFGKGKNYDPIASARINAGQPGTGDGTTTGGGNTTANGSDYNGETITDNVQPDSSGGTATNGSQDALAVIDGTAGPQVSDSSGAGETSDFASADDGVNASQGSTGFSVDKLTGVTGLTDCATGLGVNLRLDGKYVPPAGWVDADTPPINDPTSNLGVCALGGTYTHTNISTCKAMQDAEFSTTPSFVDTTLKATADSILILMHFTAYPWSLHEAWSYPTGETPLTQAEVDAIGPATAWPTNGSYDLAIIDGKIISNQYDSEAPASAAAGTTSVELCAAGGRKVKVEAAIDGGTIMYEVDPISGAGTGMARTYNKDGSLRAAGDYSAQFVQSNLPK